MLSSALKQSVALHSTTASTACAFSSSAVVLVNAQRKAAARAAGRFKSNASQRNSVIRKQVARGASPRHPPHLRLAQRNEALPKRQEGRQKQEDEGDDKDDDDTSSSMMWAPSRRRALQVPTGRLTRRQELELNERQVRKDLARLSARLSDADQREASQRAEAELPPLDEDELQILYDALQLPEPVDAETRRLAERERKKLAVPQWQQRLHQGVTQARQLLPPSPTSHELHARPASHQERLDARLNALVQRLADLDVSVGTSATGQQATSLSDQRADLAQRVASLLAGKRNLQRQEASARLASTQPQTNETVSFDSVDLAISSQRSPVNVRAEVPVSSASTLFSSAEARNGVLDRIEQFLDSMPAPDSKEAEQIADLPTGLITGPEWRALAVACARDTDDVSLDRLVRLMIRSGQSRDIGLFNEVMDVYAQQGDVERCSNALAVLKAANMQPTDHTHHCIVKAHLQAGQPDRALTILNSLEDETPASMATYTMVLQALLQVPAAARPTFWALFYRMRMVAHPVPDAPLYAVAIRACALGVANPGDAPRSGADAERALDLFREMTTRHRVRPTAETYNALTLALSQRPDTLLQAFSMLREMVELEQKRITALLINPDAEENKDLTCFAPDRRTYNALLKGCAKAGDLRRARWVLAEMLRNASALWEEGSTGRGLSEHDRNEVEARRPDADTLLHVFYAYASFKPAVTAKQIRSSAADKDPATETAPSDNNNNEVAPRPADAAQSFTPEVPATSAQVVAEAQGLLSRVLADQAAGPDGALFSNIRPSTQLVHAYLAVLTAHLPSEQILPAVRKAFLGSSQGGRAGSAEGEEASLFENLGVRPDAHTYALVLETCAAAIKTQRTQADALAQQTWKMWRLLEAQHILTERKPQSPVDVIGARTAKPSLALAKRADGDSGVDEKTIQRAWAAMIRNYAKSDKLDEAMATVRDFVQLYPPPKRPDAPSSDVPLSSLLAPVTGATLHRAMHYAPRPSPRIVFRDVDLLHLRLVASEKRPRDLAYLAWVTHSYGASARTKRAPTGRKSTTQLATEEMQRRVPIPARLHMAGLHLSPASLFVRSEKLSL